MPVPYSNDLRKRMIQSYEEGKSVQEIVENYKVTKSAVYSLIHRYKSTQSYEALPQNGGRKSKLSEEQLKLLQEKILAQPDIELSTLKEELCLSISLPGLCKIINHKLGLKRKKNAIRQRTT